MAAKNKWSRIEALMRNKGFLGRYAESFADHRKGLKGVLFPAGTYWLRRFVAVVCEPWPVAGAAAAPA